MAARKSPCSAPDTHHTTCQNTSAFRHVHKTWACPRLQSDMRMPKAATDLECRPVMQVPKEVDAARSGCTAGSQHASVGRKPEVSFRQTVSLVIPLHLACTELESAAKQICLTCNGLIKVAFFRLDMASFVTTWMDPEATALIAQTQAVNIVDTSQYPQCTEMEQRSASALLPTVHLVLCPRTLTPLE